MRLSTSLISAAVAATSLAVAAAPAHAAAVLFASFDTGTSNASNIDWVRNGNGGSLFTTSTATGTTLGAAAVKFTFVGDPSLADFDGLKANLTLSATATNSPAQHNGATYTQTGLDNGVFSFVYAGASQVLDGVNLISNSTVLLSGTFQNAWIQGAGGVGGVDVTIGNGGTAEFSSSIYDLSKSIPGSDEFTLHLGNVAPNFGAIDPSSGCTMSGCTYIGSTGLNSFRAHTGGDFQFNYVPEPSSWALMILGFGGAGVMLRGRRKAYSRAAKAA